MAQAYTKVGWVSGSPPAMNGPNLDKMDQGILLASAPLVTALPANPADGQECNFLADAANGVVWHLIYRAAEAGAHKWYFTGGMPLLSKAGILSTSVTADTADPTGPSFVIPVAGDYDCEVSARVDGPATTDGQFHCGMGLTAILDETLSWRAQSGNFGWIESSKRLRYLNLTGGATLQWRHYCVASTPWRMLMRRAFLWPVRLG